MNRESRRQFLTETAPKLAGLAALGNAALHASPLGLPIGLELYTVRAELAKDFAGTIKKTAAIGYKEVEMFDFFRKPAAEIRHVLSDAGLTCPSAHYQLEALKTKLDPSIDYAKQLGLSYMLCAWLDPGDRKSLDDYKRHAEAFNQIGEKTKKVGIHFAYHNHNFEFKPYGDVMPFDEILRLTDPQLVGIEMDCYWVTSAGKDPVDYIKRYPGRFPILHIKDRKPGHPSVTDVTENPPLFTEVGRGMIDWKRIFAAAPQGGVKHYFVEQDACDGPPFESARISYEYLKDLRV